MKKLIVALSTVFGLMAGVASASEKPMSASLDSAIPSVHSMVAKTEESSIVSPTLQKQWVKIKVEYITDETGRNYVVYIQSDHPELHDKIIRMVEKMPAQQTANSKKNQFILEYEL